MIARGSWHEILLLLGTPGELLGQGAGQGAQVGHVAVSGSPLRPLSGPREARGGRDLVRGQASVLVTVVGLGVPMPGLQGGVATRHRAGEGCGRILENVDFWSDYTTKDCDNRTRKKDRNHR